MSDKTYNGWTNYATWRVNLEMFDGGDWQAFNLAQEHYELAVDLKDWAEYMIESTTSAGLARDYALAFLDDVNWKEIAKHMIADYADEVEA